MIAVGVLLAAVGVAAIAGGKSSDDSDTPQAQLPPPPRGGKEIVHEEIGATLNRPPGWTVSRSDRTLMFRSPDQTSALSIFSPPGKTRGRRRC